MKKLINLLCVVVGILGTLGYQTYFPCSEEAVSVVSDSTKVDSVVVAIVPVADTTKKDTVK